MSFMLPQMRSYEGQQAVSYRVVLLGQSHDPSEIAARTALRTLLLQPCIMTVDRYMSRLDRQARGSPFTAIQDVSILLAPGEDEYEEDNEFIRWVYRARHLSSMMALRASANVADVRL